EPRGDAHRLGGARVAALSPVPGSLRAGPPDIQCDRDRRTRPRTRSLAGAGCSVAGRAGGGRGRYWAPVRPDQDVPGRDASIFTVLVTFSIRLRRHPTSDPRKPYR